MPRKIDRDKYLRIIERLERGETQSSIVTNEKCSYGTISSAKQWDKEGRPTTITAPSKTVANTSKIIFSIPNFWLDFLNEDIEEGIWTDYSDAIVDIIRTYFRTRMDSYKTTHGGIPTFADKGRNFKKIKKDILKELKES